jgi:hypothetical protein
MTRYKAVQACLGIVCLFFAWTCHAQSQDCEGGQAPVHGNSLYKPEFKRITRYCGTEIPAGQLKDSLARLEGEANDGDDLAAAQVYAGLSACAGWKQRSDALFEQRCAGITDDDLAGQGKWLTMAAARGNRGAQYNYAMAGVSAMVPASAMGQPDSDEVKNYHQLAAGYLQDLAEQCNVDAIGAIANMGSDADGHFGGDPELAYKYAAIKSQLDKKTDSNKKADSGKKMESNDPLMAKAEAKLPATVNSATLKKSAAEFVQDHCK